MLFNNLSRFYSGTNPICCTFCSAATFAQSLQLTNPVASGWSCSWLTAAQQDRTGSMVGKLWRFPFPSGRASHLLSSYFCLTFSGYPFIASSPFTFYSICQINFVPLTINPYFSDHLSASQSSASFVRSPFFLSPFIRSDRISIH